MGKPTGFIELARSKQPSRPVSERLHDWREVYMLHPVPVLEQQGARCMDCGIPFCHQGCPLGNLIPDWNDLVYRHRWETAIERLLATNNFPEFTGRLCPAPCEGACVLGINADPVTIKSIEWSVIERAFQEGWIVPRPPASRTGKKVAVVGSGPAGLAAADQLNKAGHWVTVLERDDRIGGLLRYGIPEFKMEKAVLDRRLKIMEQEGVTFQTNAHVGVTFDAASLQRDYDAVVLACGATVGRDLPIPGRELKGIHFAMEYLPQQNRKCEGDDVAAEEFITAEGKHVVIIGGGDTGADCLGTAHRQGAKSVHQLEIVGKPPLARASNNPWPEWPQIFRVSSAHEEGGERLYAVSTTEFVGDGEGRVKALKGVQVEQKNEGGRLTFAPIAGTEFELKADLVLLAMGFTGAERPGLVTDLGIELTPRGNVKRDARWMTNVPGIFVAGDMQRGQSLIVWAIAEGRSAARGVDTFLMGRSDLPAPVQ
jgi:glutamate synthase (NADPH/NADH) small chain